MNRILVTGAAGFIGSHLIEELLQNSNNFIVGIDNFYSGLETNIALLKDLDKRKQFIFEKLDICDSKSLEQLVEKNKIQYIFHLAAVVSVQESIKNPKCTNDVNLKGTLNILESARKSRIKRIVFSSSAAVYGDEPTLPKNEFSLTQPISPYGFEKLMSEHYMELFYKRYGIETISLRYFNVYGPRQSVQNDYSGVISVFIDKLKNNLQPQIYGDGEQSRDFVYVKDVTKINIEAMFTPGLKNDIFCVGTFRKTSINRLFELLKKKFSIDISCDYANARNGDIRESLCDNTKVMKTFDLQYFVSFEEGVKYL